MTAHSGSRPAGPNPTRARGGAQSSLPGAISATSRSCGSARSSRLERPGLRLGRLIPGFARRSFSQARVVERLGRVSPVAGTRGKGRSAVIVVAAGPAARGQAPRFSGMPMPGGGGGGGGGAFGMGRGAVVVATCSVYAQREGARSALQARRPRRESGRQERQHTHSSRSETRSLAGNSDRHAGRNDPLKPDHLFRGK